MAEQVLKKQMEHFLFNFDEADKDNSGSLSFPEVFNVLKSQGFKGTEQEAQTIFKDFDKDKNNSISRQEFDVAMKNLPKMAISEFYLRRMFKALDKDGSGSLSSAEIFRSMKQEQVGLDIFNETTFELMAAQNKDSDGKLNYEEFLRAFKIESENTELRKIFNDLDTDKSGFLKKEEIKAALSFDSELQLSITKLVGLLMQLKTDADQKISYEEFLKAWQQESNK